MKIFNQLPGRESIHFRGGYFSQIVLSAWIIFVLGSYYYPVYFYQFRPSLFFRDRYVTVDESDGFLSNLNRAHVREPWARAVRSTSVAINGRLLDAFFGHTPSTVSYHARIEGATVLRFSIAMIPESWKKGGDGVLFKVSLQEEGSPESVVFSQYIDPKANEEERIWHDQEIDLSPYGEGRDVIIKFITEGGPHGDRGWDWAVWGEPHLAARESEEK